MSSSPSRTNSESRTPIYLWFLQVLTVWGVTAKVIWLSLTPKTPISMITGVSGWNFTLRTHNLSSSSFTLDIEISNPNKRMGVYFNYINVSLIHSGATIGNKSLPGFYQGFKRTSSCKVVVNVSDQRFLGGVIAGTGGSTELKVGLEAAIQYEIFSWRTKHHVMDVAATVPIGLDGRVSENKNITLLAPSTHIEN